MKEKPRILFFGYSEVGHTCLDLLLQRGDRVVALITHEDRPDENIWFQTPAAAAGKHGVPVFTPASANTPEWVDRIAALRPDLILSAYYRQMISTRILDLARLGGFNLHGSLLPKFRGRAPVNWAILHGATETGMTLHRMVRRADAGPIVDQAAVPIGPRDNAEQVFRKLLPVARELLARQIDALLAGTARETPQDETQATYFGGRTPEDGRIDWSAPSGQVFNLIRAVTKPYPGAFSDVGSGRLTIWWAEPDSSAAQGRNGRPGQVLSLDPLRIATSDGALEITQYEWVTSVAPHASSRASALSVGQTL